MIWQTGRWTVWPSRFSRKFDPGYEEKREREIKGLKEERRIRLRIEKEIEGELNEETMIDADPNEDAAEITASEEK